MEKTIPSQMKKGFNYEELERECKEILAQMNEVDESIDKKNAELRKLKKEMLELEREYKDKKKLLDQVSLAQIVPDWKKLTIPELDDFSASLLETITETRDQECKVKTPEFEKGLTPTDRKKELINYLRKTSCYFCKSIMHTLEECQILADTVCKRCGEKGHTPAKCSNEMEYPAYPPRNDYHPPRNDYHPSNYPHAPFQKMKHDDYHSSERKEFRGGYRGGRGSRGGYRGGRGGKEDN